ncbi:MAG TPA: Ig-like domain-containing protein [Actinomycetota bacterium]|nr:Ig-like domain-containing protein [Actinomycetota bacterium]
MQGGRLAPFGHLLVLATFVGAMLGPLLAAPAQAQAGTTVTGVTVAGSPATVGTTVDLTATISSPTLLGPVTVNFTVVSGPNQGFQFSCTVSGLLQTACAQGYSSQLSGTDTINAGTPGQANPVQVTVQWLGVPAAMQVSPVATFNHVGDSVRITATVVDGTGNPVQGATVAFSLSGTGGESPTSGNQATDANGNAGFSFTNSKAGTTNITASTQGAGGRTLSAKATATFAGDPASITLTQQNPNGLAPVGGNDVVSANVLDSASIPVGDGTQVSFTVTGAGATSGSALTSGGNAVFKFSSNVTGTSTIVASAHGITSSPVTATWQTPVASAITLTPRLSSQVIGNTQNLIAQVNDQFGAPYPGALVRFSVLGVNAQSTTSSGSSDQQGQVGFQEQGANIGFDEIVAFVDLQDDDTLDPGDPSATAVINWVHKPGQGYWLVASDGGIFNYGPSTTFAGSAGSIHLNKPIVGMAATPTGFGYWLVASDGGIFSYGDAIFQGSTGSIHLNKPIVGMARTPDGNGYWLVASDGGIFAFGSAKFQGSTGSIHLNKPIVGMAATADGGGYWLVASDGGIFAFGDAQFVGSAGSVHLNQPIVGMAAMPDGGGYWLAAADGGIFNYGDAAFDGSAGGMHLNKPIVGIGAVPDGSGYFLGASDGGVFNYGQGATSFGSAGGMPLNKPIVGMAVAP